MTKIFILSQYYRLCMILRYEIHIAIWNHEKYVKYKTISLRLHAMYWNQTGREELVALNMAGDFSIPPQAVAEAIEESWAQLNDAEPPDKSRKNWFKPDPNVIVLTAVSIVKHRSWYVFATRRVYDSSIKNIVTLCRPMLFAIQVMGWMMVR